MAGCSCDGEGAEEWTPERTVMFLRRVPRRHERLPHAAHAPLIERAGCFTTVPPAATRRRFAWREPAAAHWFRVPDDARNLHSEWPRFYASAAGLNMPLCLAGVPEDPIASPRWRLCAIYTLCGCRLSAPRQPRGCAGGGASIDQLPAARRGLPRERSSNLLMGLDAVLKRPDFNRCGLCDLRQVRRAGRGAAAARSFARKTCCYVRCWRWWACLCLPPARALLCVPEIHVHGP